MRTSFEARRTPSRDTSCCARRVTLRITLIGRAMRRARCLQLSCSCWARRQSVPGRHVRFSVHAWGSKVTLCAHWRSATIRERTGFPGDRWSVAGRWPMAGERAVVLGSGFAELLGAKAGERVVVEARTVKGAINALEVDVVGVANTTNAKVDNFGVWMS